jgi:signal transduction histidine kinase/ActR/RegA family two-component response regulator
MSRWWGDRSLRAKGLLVLSLPLLTLLISTLIFLLVLGRMDRSQDRVAHARHTQDRLAEVYLLLVDGETGIRGYLATGGDERFLEPTVTARQRLPDAVTALGTLVGTDPTQAARIDRLQALLKPGYQLRPPSRSRIADPTFVRTWMDKQRASTDQFRSVLSDIWRTEDRMLAERLDERDAWITRGRVVAGAGLGLGVVGGLAATVAFTLGISRRLERVVARTDGLRQGEAPDFVDPGGDEIGVLSRRLTDVASRWLLWKSEAQDARVAAESANQAKSEFLSRMSHELRTPLNAVLGFAQILEMDLPEDRQESVRQIRRAGVHLLNLINEVLDISRIEAGQLALSPEPVRMADVVDEVVELMGPIAADRSVAIRATEALDCGAYVLADRQRTKQIILNLTSNAVKYNNPGGHVVIDCTVENREAAVTVVDDGIGIAEADLERLFIPFERLVAADSEIEGTGVGLAISQRLATAMNGRIEVASEVARGSTFTLWLPTTVAPDAVTLPDVRRAAPATASGRDEAPGVGLTVLSIEDNPANTRLLQEIVNRRPEWQLVAAGQGRMGLDLAAAEPPDLVLLDLHLPDLRGEEILRRLKADPRTARVPVIVVSADATPGQVERLRAAGAEDYLTKPVEVSAVLAALDRVQHESRVGRGRARWN